MSSSASRLALIEERAQAWHTFKVAPFQVRISTFSSMEPPLDHLELSLNALDNIRGHAVPDDILFTYIISVAKALEDRYSCLDSDFPDVERRIELLQEATSLQEITSAHRAEGLISLAEAYHVRGVHRLQVEHFNTAIELLTSFPVREVSHSGEITNRVHLVTGSAFRQRYILLGDGADLARAFQAHSALAASDQSHQTSLTLGVFGLTEIARTFFEQSRFTLDLAVLDSSIEFIRRAMDICDNDNVFRHLPYMLHGRTSIFRCVHTGDFSPADEAVSFAKQGLSLAPYGHRDYYEASGSLGVCLYLQAWQLGDMHALDECVRVCDVALPTHGQPDGRPFSTIINGANGLEMRYRKDGRIEDLDDAISRLQSYRATFREGAVIRPELLTALSNILLTHFHTTGEARSVDQAVEAQLAVLAECDPNNKRRSNWLSNLAACRLAQYRSSGDITNLEDAVAVAEQGFDMQMGKKGSTWEIQITTLIELRLELYKVCRRAYDLERATDLAREWLDHRSSEELNAGSYLCIAASVFRIRYENTRTADDLRTAIDLLEEALKIFATKTDFEYSVTSLLEYGVVLQHRFIAQGTEGDAQQALQRRTDALQMLYIGHPRRALCLMSIAESELCAGSPTFAPKEGIQHLLDALSLRYTSAHMRLIEVARILGLLDEGDVFEKDMELAASLLDVYRNAVDLMPQVASLGLSRDARLRVLANTSALVTRGWAHAVSCGDVEIALEMLETGRGIFWMQSLQLRTKFDHLPSQLAHRLSSIAKALEMRMPESVGGDEGRAAMNREVIRRRQLSDEFEELLKEARSLPGYEDLLQGPRYEDLIQAAVPFPVAIIVPGERNSHALIMNSRREVTILHLPNMSIKRAEQLAHYLSQAIDAPRQRMRDMSMLHRSFRIVKTSEDSEVDIYSELWRFVMHPIIVHLGLERNEGRRRPRIMLCPTGIFTRLPLHASGEYSLTSGDCVSDFVVPSYTPTICALLNARRSFVPVARESAKVLLAVVPKPFTGEPLPHTENEAVTIQARVPNGSLHMMPPTAVVEDVLKVLPSAPIVHLACHGVQDPKDALQSGFVMNDSLLTISKLMELELPNAFLAVLSACETAKGDLTQPDQAIHLARTMMFAGFRSIVATMWSMGDLDGPVVAQSLYEGLFGGDRTHLDPNDVPYALDAAVRKLRQAGHHPSFWATYVHIGI